MGVDLDAAAFEVEIDAAAVDAHVPEDTRIHQHIVFVHVVRVAGVFVGAVFAVFSLFAVIIEQFACDTVAFDQLFEGA